MWSCVQCACVWPAEWLPLKERSAWAGYLHMTTLTWTVEVSKFNAKCYVDEPYLYAMVWRLSFQPEESEDFCILYIRMKAELLQHKVVVTVRLSVCWATTRKDHLNVFNHVKILTKLLISWCSHDKYWLSFLKGWPIFKLGFPFFFLVGWLFCFCGNKQRVEFGNAKEIWKIYETS